MSGKMFVKACCCMKRRSVLSLTLLCVTACDDPQPPAPPKRIVQATQEASPLDLSSPPLPRHVATAAPTAPLVPPPDPEQVDWGRSVFELRGCASCHSVDADAEPYLATGPPLFNIFGSTVELQGGRTVIADEEYLRRSIQEPAADKVRGYYSDMLIEDVDDKDTEALIAYFKTLKPPRD